MRQFQRIVAAGLLALPLTLGLGCSNSNSGSNGGGGTSSIVDLAVGDTGRDTGIGQIFLWLDVLANKGPGLPTPDVTLDVATMSPVDLKFHNGDLYVATTDSWTPGTAGGVYIFRNYLTLADGDTADAHLDGTSTPAGPINIQHLAIENDILVAGTYYCNSDCANNPGVFIWDNASTITDGQAPDVHLNQVTTGLPATNFDDISDVELLNGRMFVSNWNGNNGFPCVAIWNNVRDLISGGAAAPDEILTDDGNFLDRGDGCKQLAVANDTLYVSGGDTNIFYVFNNASTMDSASLPDVVVAGCGDVNTDTNCLINAPADFLVSNNTLLIANHNYNNTPNDSPGVVGYYPADALFNTQVPILKLTDNASLGSAERLAVAGGALFITGNPTEDEYAEAGIFVYNGAVTDTLATLSAIGNPDPNVSYLDSPTGLAAVVRGTIDPDAGT